MRMWSIVVSASIADTLLLIMFPCIKRICISIDRFVSSTLVCRVRRSISILLFVVIDLNHIRIVARHPRNR